MRRRSDLPSEAGEYALRLLEAHVEAVVLFEQLECERGGGFHVAPVVVMYDSLMSP